MNFGGCESAMLFQGLQQNTNKSGIPNATAGTPLDSILPDERLLRERKRSN
jgi:hypothetical protein